MTFNRIITMKEAIKPALDEYCKEKNIESVSESTIGRVIKDLKELGMLMDNKVKITVHGGSGNLIVKKKKRIKKLKKEKKRITEELKKSREKYSKANSKYQKLKNFTKYHHKQTSFRRGGVKKLSHKPLSREYYRQRGY